MIFKYNQWKGIFLLSFSLKNKSRVLWISIVNVLMFLGYAFWQWRLLFQTHTSATVILEWGNKRKGLKDEENLTSLNFGVAKRHFWKSCSSVFCSEQDSHQHWKWWGMVWSSKTSKDGKFSRFSRQSVPSLYWPPGSALPHVWPEHTTLEFVTNLVTVEKIHLYRFLELPSSSYGIPLGHPVAASL